MQYRLDKYANKISILGYGCMRFTQSVGGVNIQKAEEEIMRAYERGVNYYDTAYIYPGSEAALGEILEKNNIRDKVYIATKLPHYLIKNAESLEKYFKEQLRRLRTDHIDYYLMHMLTDVKTWERLKELGIEKWLEDKKASGEIRQVGFSYHGNSDMFIKLIDSYEWDFCQVQYNYLDEHSQAGVTGVKYASQKGLPIIIMEPLRGGRLANNLPQEAVNEFKKFDSNCSPAEWSFRWLWNQEEITCVLSGMNSIEMIEENTRSADEANANEFSKNEFDLISRVVKIINSKMKVGCTGCRYCMPCPQGVDIPGIFSAYNRRYSDGKFKGLADYVMCTTIRKDSTSASNCIKCGKCEKHCPQHIEIRTQLENAKKEFEGIAFKVGSKVIKKIMKY